MNSDERFQCLSDEELVQEIVKTKNTMLFGVLYDRYSKVIYNKCHSFAKRDEDAKDLTQDVFLKLFIKLGSFKGNSKFSTWLYAFTYNYCVNYIRRTASKKKAKINDDYQLLIQGDDYNLFQLRVGKLERALEAIEPNDKMILLLKYQDEVSIKDISDILDIGESAVMMRIKRAKGRIIKVYNEKLLIYGKSL